jgi:hypothetical protein
LPTGLALRSEVFPPSLLSRIAEKLDGSGYSSAWFPDVGSYDALELASLTLGATSRVSVGTGVVRLLEHDASVFVRRLRAVSGFAPNRFILGVGTGSRGGARAIKELVQRVDFIRANMSSESPRLFFSALREKMFKASVRNAKGVLLNFCSSDYVRRLISSLNTGVPEGFTVAGYVKVFFAENEKLAMNSMLDEFVKYDGYPNYHKLFIDMGVNRVIERLRERKTAGSETLKELSQISLCNPSSNTLFSLLEVLEQSGLSLPIVYPYVIGSDDYKLEVVQQLVELSSSFGH